MVKLYIYEGVMKAFRFGRQQSLAILFVRNNDRESSRDVITCILYCRPSIYFMYYYTTVYKEHYSDRVYVVYKERHYTDDSARELGKKDLIIAAFQSIRVPN